MQNELRYEQSSGKLHDDLRTCPHSCDCISTTPQLGCQHFAEQPQSNFPGPHKFLDLSLTFGLFPDFSLTSAEFPDISRFSETPKKWQPLHLMAEGANTSGQRCPFPQIGCRFRHPFNVNVNRGLIQHRIYTVQKVLIIFGIGVLVRALTVSNHSCSLSPKSGQDRVWEKLRVRLRVSSGLQLTGSMVWTGPFRPNHFCGLSKAVFQKAVWTL